MRKTVTLCWLILLFMTLTGNVSAQVRNISGKVTSSSTGQPVAGVSVVAKGTTTGTITNRDGNYHLAVPQDVTTLVFSHVGYSTTEIVISGSDVNVTLEPEVFSMEEVIAVAYGTSSRAHFTGSASMIGQSELSTMHSTSVTRSLQGRVSGLQATSGTGQPGEGADLRIRGISTFGDSRPLIVLDGFPYDGNINSLPVSDIMTMTILKDAAATALYGSRAANGVIIILTRSGSTDRSKLQINASYGISHRALPEYDRVSTAQWYELMWETLRNINLAQGESPGPAAQKASDGLIPYIGGYNAYNIPDTELVDTQGKLKPGAQLLWTDDWQEELFVPGRKQEISLSAEGNSDKTSWYASASMLNDKGIVRSSDYNRYSARLNLRSAIHEFIQVGMNLSGAVSDQNYPLSSGTNYTNPFMFTRLIAPIYPVYQYDLQGNLQEDASGKRLYDYGNSHDRNRPSAPNVNPLGTIGLDTRLYRQDNTGARAFMDAKILQGLHLRISGSADLYSANHINHENQQYGPSAVIQGRSTRESGRTFSFTSNQILSYSVAAKLHTLSVMAGHESYATRYNVLNAARSGFPFPGMIELAAAPVAESSSSYENNHRIESYLAKADYSWDQKYYLSANIRSDGNSIFHERTRWGQFWSVGLAWRIAREDFMKDIAWLSNLKLRTSYGRQGNDRIGTLYAYQGLYATGWNNLNYPGLLASRLPTPDLTWESLESFNIGIDSEIFEVLEVNVEYYIRNNNNLLFAQPLPPSSGFTTIDANIAKLQNKGFDVEINAKIIRLPGIQWNMGINLSHYRNVIRELPGGSIISGNKRWESGRSVYDFWVQEWAGVNPENGKAQWYKDELLTVNGVTQYDEKGNPVKTGNRLKTENYSEASRYYSGSAIPDLTGGIVQELRIRNFDLTAVTSFGLGGKIYDNSYAFLMHAGSVRGDHWHTDILNRWTEKGQITNIPVLNGSQDAMQQSSRFLTPADYFSVREVTLGYNLNPSGPGNSRLPEARFYVSGQNLWIHSARKGMDPIQNFHGTHSNVYMPVQTISLGVNLSF